jgi:hypothetical protein
VGESTDPNHKNKQQGRAQSVERDQRSRTRDLAEQAMGQYEHPLAREQLEEAAVWSWVLAGNSGIGGPHRWED